MTEDKGISLLERKLGFDRIRSIISSRCSTEYAAARVASEAFSTNRGEITRRLALTDEMRLIAMFEDAFPSGGYIDCLPFLEPLASPGANIDTFGLGKMRTMLQTLGGIDTFFAGVKYSVYPNLKHLASGIVLFPEISARIDGILDRDGNVKDTASDQLYAIRCSLRDKESAISRRTASVLKRAQTEGIADADASVSVRDGKMLIPVSASNKRKLPGFVYGESATGKTVFIQPAEIVELENEISELHFAETREIFRILSEFSDFVRQDIPALKEDAILLGEFDFLMAKARTALDFIAGMPLISESGQLNLRKARHPILEKALAAEGKKIVPLTVSLSPQKHILLISGPNAGGKSVCLKTVGLLQYMFQWGMLIPTSETSELPVFTRIMVDIGDGQSLESDLSTYSAFLAQMKDMLDKADGNTLVLIDEFGSGTEPAAGGAIAEAILAELDRRNVYGVITTHYTSLKLYAGREGTGVVNGAMQFDAAAIAPLFKLEQGLPGNSFAFELARKMGLPESILKDAEAKVGEDYVDMERNLRKIARSRRNIDERLQRIKNTDKALENITGKYQKELLQIQEEKKKILAQAREEAAEIVRGANRQVENTIRTIRETNADKERTAEARRGLQAFVGALAAGKQEQEKQRGDYIDEKLHQLSDRMARRSERKGKTVAGGLSEEQQAERRRQEAFRSGPLKVGEKVRIKENGMVGEVSIVSTKAVTVIVGNITSKMPLDKVERITSGEYREAVKKEPRRPVAAYTQDAAIKERRLSFKPEIDVRGERVMEALDIVTRFVDDAIMLSMPSVRIVHGKGTGALREEIQKLLRTVPGVESVHDEDLQLGGTGVTVVVLK